MSKVVSSSTTTTKLNKPAAPEQVVTNDLSLVIPVLNLEQTPFATGSTKFNDEDLINLADDHNSELFLDDSNVQLIIVNEANQDAAVMLMTSNEVKLSDAVASEPATDPNTLMM